MMRNFFSPYLVLLCGQCTLCLAVLESLRVPGEIPNTEDKGDIAENFRSASVRSTRKRGHESVECPLVCIATFVRCLSFS